MSAPVDFSGADMGINQATTDAVDDTKLFAGLVNTFGVETMQITNYIQPLLDFAGSAFKIVTSTRPGWLTGRRPTTGLLYPRGVYNK